MVKVKSILNSLFIVIIAFSFSSRVMALAPDTHSAINKYITQREYLDDYLKNQLGIPDGKDTFFNNKKVFDLVANGGAEEDAGIRSMNHFLNPITNKGLSLNYSALEWATMPLFNQKLSPFASWNDVRYYYFKALTSVDKTTRDDNFAMTFQGIGKVMHLVEDMSVPAHTRSDKHPSLWIIGGDDYERWSKTFIKDIAQIVNDNPTTFFEYNDTAFLVSKLFDTNQYIGTNPDITISSKSIGLSEYTNANFLSFDTIFTDDFSYPSYNPGITVERYVENEILYLSKIGVGEDIKYFARANNFYNYLPSDYKKLALHLDDDKIYNNYAQFLIPRAIGYSSQVLKYFFRGQLDVVLVDGNIKVKNASDETISNGEFKLYYDNAAGMRTLLTTASANTLAPNGDPQTINFTLPEGVTAKSYMLVYQGQLGEEPNAVIGKFIPVDNNLPIIYIEVGSQCIVWDVENGKFYDKVTTDSSTPENPQYAVFPCDPTTISMWKEQQTKTTMHNASMWKCGRMEPPANGAEEQLCPFALDAVGAMDTYSKIYESSDVYPQYSYGSEDILIYSKNSKYDDGFLRSNNSDVLELNSSVWYRVKWERHISGDSFVTSDYWWGAGCKQSSDVQEKYSIYSVGEPFGIPFFEIYNHQIWEREYYGKGQDDYPYCRGSWNATRLAPHRNSVIYKLIWSDKLVLHVAYVTAVMNKEENNYDVIYDDEYGGFYSGPGTSVLQPRIQGLKVNLDYKKDRLIKDGKYDLGHIPVAPANLKTAIQDLIDKRYMDLGLPVTDIPYNMFMDVIFYEVKSI